MQPADFLIEHASLIATCAGPAPRRGRAQGDISPLANGAIAGHQGEIVFVGPAADLDARVHVLPGATRIDARGCTVTPGFVDAHTHIVFAGDGQGGLDATVAATRAASEEKLVAATRQRLDQMLACGTTTCEAKSGYGLTVESELKQLRVLRQLDHEHDVDIMPTFFGAHAIPPEYRHDRQAYVRLVIDEMVPAVAAEGLADWCDVTCDSAGFTAEEARAICGAGYLAGLLSRMHASQLAYMPGELAGVDHVDVWSVDHLVDATLADADTLAGCGAAATLLPIAAFYLKQGRYAPARMLVDRSVPVALGSDLSADAGRSPSMTFAMTLACFAMDMTVEEALVAATINAAHSLNRAHAIGSLEAGKLMDAVIVQGELPDLMRVGVPTIRMVIKRGKVVHWAS